MFGPLRPHARLTLAAALRDVDARDPAARERAISSLAPALLERLGDADAERGARWNVAARDPQGAVAVSALRRASESDAAGAVGLSLVARAQLGDVTLLDDARVRAVWTSDGAAHGSGPGGAWDSDARGYVAESAIIALSLLHEAAHRAGEREIEARCEHALAAALDHPVGGVRAQAADAWARTWTCDKRSSADAYAREAAATGPTTQTPSTARGAAPPHTDSARPDIAAALSRLIARLTSETDPAAQLGLLSAIVHLQPQPTGETARALSDLIARTTDRAVAYEAALGLAAGTRIEAAPVLVFALADRERRDDALEALAMLGPVADEATVSAVRRVLQSWLISPYTRVRAAYALAAMRPDDGHAALDALARHVRPAVRLAVAEARALLATRAGA